MNDSQQITILRKALVDVVQKLGEMPGWRKVEANSAELDAELERVGVVLVYDTSECVNVAFMEDGEWCGDAPNSVGNVTHWMPRPVLPYDPQPTLAETLQAICASALGDIEVNDE